MGKNEIQYNRLEKVLTIAPKNGWTFTYVGVPLFVWKNLKEIHNNGGPIGSYFVQNIKDNYKMRKG
jgi:hypothetical protein